jgi:hypothetical protein
MVESALDQTRRWRCIRGVRSNPMNGHRQTRQTGPFRANSGRAAASRPTSSSRRHASLEPPAIGHIER